jgi:hypothetical protein
VRLIFLKDPQKIISDSGIQIGEDLRAADLAFKSAAQDAPLKTPF